MKKRCLFVILIVTFLMGCTTITTTDLSTPPGVSSLKPSDSPTANLSTPILSSPTISATTSLTPRLLTTQALRPIITTTPTTTATAIPVAIEFPTPASGSEIRQQCLTIEDSLPEGVALTGTLVLDTKVLSPLGNEGNVYLIDPPGREVRLMPEMQDRVDLTPTVYNISPNRKWFYYFMPSASGTGSQLHISSIDGQERQIAYWNEVWGETVFWLDDQRLVIWPPKQDWQDYGTAILLNPFTGEWQELLPNFASGLNSLVLLVDYNTTLTRAIYLSGNYYVLWDVESQKDLWKIRGANYSYLLRGWSPDGSRFVMMITKEDVRQSDLFLITSNGQETQLTHLAEAYPSMPEIYIENLAWSPDGRYIAFFVRVMDGTREIKGPTLMVVDTTTKQITDYCITVSLYGHIVWAPNSDQLIVASPIDYQEYIETVHTATWKHVKVVLVDIVQVFAAQIVEEMAPVGWMVTTP